MTLRSSLDKFYAFLDRPLALWSRPALAVLVIPLVLSFWFPLWKLKFEAPQYPKGLSMQIHAYKLEGGHDGKDIPEINELNHYIGMHKIDRSELNDLDWIPFALGMLVILGLRCAAVGTVRSLIDLTVITTYVAGFSLFRFIYKLYTFGHELDPKAAFKVDGFTPPLLGTKHIANFTVHSTPQAATYLIGIFATGVAALLGYHLITGRLAATRADRAAKAPTPAPAPAPTPPAEPTEPAAEPPAATIAKVA
jgi:copper chaperone NosL